MNYPELQKLLEDVARGGTSAEAAARQLVGVRDGMVAETGDYATLDLQRRARCGFAEVVFGQGKTDEQLVGIVGSMQKHGRGDGTLVTRIGAEIGAHLVKEFPRGEYSALGRTFWIPPERERVEPKAGKVAVVTAGTSDLPVAEEARVTASAWNCEVTLIADVGVAGIHRLFRRLPDMQGADAIIAVAGMEAALPSVLGGLVDCPVIGVPTSIGYGAHFHGLTSLLGMLNSCSSNVVTVNIDAGFNGGYVAGMIARRMGLARRPQP